MEKEYYIYKFLNKKQEVIYVGITNDIERRMRKQHFTNNGHLPQECYKETKEIYFSKCNSKDDASIKERYLINVLSPKYNTKMNNNSEFGFKINNFHWIEAEIKKKKHLTDWITKEAYMSFTIFDRLIEKYSSGERVFNLSRIDIMDIFKVYISDSDVKKILNNINRCGYKIIDKYGYGCRTIIASITPNNDIYRIEFLDDINVDDMYMNNMFYPNKN